MKKNTFLILLALSFLMPLFLVRAQEKKDFEISRYDFQQSPPNITLEHLLVDKMDELGEIGGSYLEASYLRDDDLIYLRLKDPAVSVGDHFMLYSDDGPVPVPGKYGKQIGRDILIKGYAEVIKVLPKAIVAKIYNAAMNITVGDKVALPIEQSLKLEPKEPATMIRGQVVRSANNLGAIAPYDFVYINRGEKDGLRVGDRLYVYRTAEGERKLDKLRPSVNIAEIVVANLGEHVGTAYVIGAEDFFDAGAFFKSAISDVKFLSQKPGETKDPSVASSSTPAKSSDPDNDEEDITTRGNSYFQFGPGIFMRVSPNSGVHRAYFNFAAEWGQEHYAIPLTFGIIKQNNQEFKLAPRAQMSFIPFNKTPRFVLSPGAGIFMDFNYNTLAGSRSHEFSMGLEFGARAKYYIADNMYASFSPFDFDLFMWRSLSSTINGVSTTQTGSRLQGRWTMHLDLGFDF